MRKKDAKNIISSYRKKQKRGPFIIGGLAIFLAVAGIALLVFYLLSGNNGVQIGFLSTKTSTPTETPTPTPVTPTATFTVTPTVTNTPTVTPTSTPSAPFEYQVQENDNCTSIAEEFEVDVNVLLVLNNLSTCLIYPGQTILIPIPGQKLPTPTPLPDDLPRGFLIEHRVRPGDSLYALAETFNSEIDRILEETNRYRRANDLREMEDSGDVLIGDIVVIPYNIGPNPIVPGGTSTPTPEP